MKILKNYKRTIIISVVILVVLVALFFHNPDKVDQQSTTQSESVIKPDSDKKVTIADEEITETESDTDNEQFEDSKVHNDLQETISETEKTSSDELTVESKADSVEEDNTKQNICTLSVRCDSILQNSSFQDDAKRGLVPDNGIIFFSENVEFFDDETVFNVVLREMKKNKIHMDFVNTPMYNSVYIKGISNIYEKDFGETSGWIYTVNGVRPSCGCSSYKLSPGDLISFEYILSL